MEAKKRIKVMVVDDSIFFCRALKADLQKHSHIDVCLLAHNGLSAIEMLKSYLPDVVILDLEMGEVSGFDVMRQIRTLHHVPFIVLSGITNGKPELKQKAADLGASYVIEKPDNESFETVLPLLIKSIEACVSHEETFVLNKILK